MVGKSLGHYEILESLGSGGMGDVYRARDTTLNRDVAIKVLPEDLADDPERLARLEREAQLLAAISHPNIATIHSLEESEGIRFLVLEFVKGESLDKRLASQRLSVVEALQLCKQIAEALEAAHEEGIIHRDLKPGNILITPYGRVKVLDFGVAKTVEATTSEVDTGGTPTATEGVTQTGVIIGTAPYMSPEQVRGRSFDGRADIWAFGCVLYEALTGKRAFDRETLADTLAAILELDPPWDALPAETPVVIRSLLRRCLRKDPKQRLHDIADARIEIDEAIGEPEEAQANSGPTPASAPMWRRALPWAAVLVMATAALAAVYITANRPADRVVLRFHIAPPSGERLLLSDDPGVAISPDGSLVAYMTERGLFVHPTDEAEARLIPGTVGVHSPFFDPGGEWVGFFDDADRTLKRIPLQGGSAELVCDAPGAHAGASWGPDETIVFSSVGAGLGVVASSGGTPQSLTTVNAAAGEIRHEFPQMLPNGAGVLFTIEKDDGRDIAVLDLATRRHETIIPGGTGAHYASTGHVVYGQDGNLMAVAFDQDRLEMTGVPFQLQEAVRATSDGSLEFSFSRDGMLVFVPPTPATDPTALVWADEHGDVSPILARDASFDEISLSPDGRHIAMHGADDVLWVYDIRRDVLSVLTSKGRSHTPTWSADGTWVYYSSRTGADSDLYRIPADLSGPAELLLARERDQYVPSVSSDGNTILFGEVDPVTGFDIWAFRLEGSGSPEVLIRTPATETSPEISPEGEWLTYVSDTSGTGEVYLRSLTGPVQQWQLSSGGGRSPRWSRDGRTVFYNAGPRVMRVNVPSSADGEPGAPIPMFENESLALQDVAPDGRLLMTELSDGPPTNLSVVLNWFEELQRLMPTAR